MGCRLVCSRQNGKFKVSTATVHSYANVLRMNWLNCWEVRAVCAKNKEGVQMNHYPKPHSGIVVFFLLCSCWTLLQSQIFSFNVLSTRNYRVKRNLKHSWQVQWRVNLVRKPEFYKSPFWILYQLDLLGSNQLCRLVGTWQVEGNYRFFLAGPGFLTIKLGPNKRSGLGAAQTASDNESRLLFPWSPLTSPAFFSMSIKYPSSKKTLILLSVCGSNSGVLLTAFDSSDLALSMEMKGSALPDNWMVDSARCLELARRFLHEPKRCCCSLRVSSFLR